MKTTSLVGGCVLDLIAGDPEWLPHPVRLMGKTISVGERLLRRFASTPHGEFFAGAILSFGVIGLSYGAARSVLYATEKINPLFGDAAEILLAWTMLAVRNLLDETGGVLDVLEAGEIEIARSRLARIVGRDTANLNETEIVRATIETAAESFCDGIIAPLFYLAIGGVPLAFAYKAANTLDSMIGHREPPYTYFGRAAARIDDAVNFLPARLSALLIVAAARLTNDDAKAGWRVWRRDAHLHSSPNAGQSEAAMAGALNVRLGGLNFYDGQPHQSAHFAEEYETPTKKSARRAGRLTLTASVLACAAAAAFCWFKNRKSD